MCKVWLVPGSHLVSIRVTSKGRDYECPVTLEQGGIGLVDAPLIEDVRRKLLNFPGLLQMVQAHCPDVQRIKLTES